ncbi:response regulator transcription factor [Belliella kenyensis]|uniref:Response regulator transcription factor n=1 Tax=Belliella kenyensis TaxID=1472724 RepID=A0ABV8EP96_9BACT|nr:helix-turn-helix transcriptional regulator [Belliella kenyensis]MCH7402789.1 helix-turn-helix transcriptional regulator [Belliella kenyensis]MDN3602494.1 helix-turn-helix transcriptional regulator [Belliella kenyensis]
METINYHQHIVIEQFTLTQDFISGIKIIFDLTTNEPIFICRNGQKKYGINPSYVRHLPLYEFKRLIFDSEDEGTFILDKSNLEDSNAPLQITYLRKRRHQNEIEVDLIFEKLVKLYIDDKAKYYKSFHIIPLNPQASCNSKIERMIEEARFIKKNQVKFNQLSKRNKEVLALMIQGLSAVEIAEKLFIGTNTVNTHKQKIKEVLGVKNSYELMKYGYAFDLI